jgi:putative ATP-binding cassette transporter
MSFLDLVRREMHGSLPKLLLMSGLGGISTAAILAAINTGLQGPSLWASMLFLIALFLFIKTQAYVTITTTAEIEAIIHKIRLRLMDQIRHSELLSIEGIGRARIVAAITSDTAVLTQASNMLAFTVQGAVLVFFVAIYVAFLSIAAILTTIVVISIAAVIFHIKNRKLIEEKQRSAEWERRLFDRLTDFLNGFKEVRLNSKRSDDLFDDAVSVSRTAANIKIHTQAETFKMIVNSQLSMYVLLGAVVFVAPHMSDALGGTSLTKATTALMFIVGAAFGLVQSIPVILNANASADRINQLEVLLKATVSSTGPFQIARKRFEKIEVRDLRFRYVDRFSDVAFQIGPIDFTLRAGELVFITGGNGSGKSTFLRVLSGLYPPDSGEIRLDGERIEGQNRDTYRSLMTAIFFDYHLFRKLYGIADVLPGELEVLLDKFRLAEKTGLTPDGEFRTLDLSGGQRRRLALIVSMLEKRPIFLLDEWTAEQDPEFRRKFYDEILPELMQAGATIVVITHDDRYLDELDLPARRIRMDEGRIVDQRSMQKGA